MLVGRTQLVAQHVERGDKEVIADDVETDEHVGHHEDPEQREARSFEAT